MATPTKKTAEKMAEKTGTLEIDRRQFLTTTAVVGGGLVLGFWLPPRAAEAAAVAGVAGEPWYRESLVPEINAWITIAPDDTVTVRISQVDLGTGVLTTNSMIVAEELQCDWSKVRAEYASANRNIREKAPEWMIIEPSGGDEAHDPAGPGHTVAVQRNTGVYRRMGVGSSSNVRENRYHLQLAGAEARERLLLAAATEWGVPAADLVAKDSVITHAATGRRTTYGVIAAQAAQIQLPDPSRIRVKTPDQWILMGTEQKNREVPLKVTGQAKYAIDVRLPDMLYAAVKCCPVWGGDVRSFNFNAIRNMPGVHSMVRLPLDPTGTAKDVSPGRTTKDGFYSGGVAVIADTWWHAHQALEAMPIEWDYGPGGTVSSASQWEDHFARLNEPGDVIADEGDVDAAIAGAARVIEATYTVPYTRRARMEPGNATVLVTDDRVDIWVGDQNPQTTLPHAAMLTGIAPENVHVHLMFLGGGYGGSGNGPQAEHAVFIANTVRGRPVKMVWTREEDWGVGTTHRPMGIGWFKAGLDADGWPIAMEVKHCHSIGGAWPPNTRGLAQPPYWVPHYRFSHHTALSHVPAGRVRATGANVNAFFMECFIDELAHAAGKDPYLYRRELITRNPPEPEARFQGSGVNGFRYRDDWLRALDMVVEMSGWGKPLPEGWAQGLAIDDRRRGTGPGAGRQGTLCAQVHTVEVTRRGQLRLHRVDAVFEEGFSLVNPLTVRKQIEGQIAWGYSDAMYQEVTIRDGQPVEVNFDTFPVSRMHEYPPELNIAFLKTDKWIEGAGEEAIPTVTPAILNAVFKITGKRIRAVPLKNHDLSWG